MLRAARLLIILAFSLLVTATTLSPRIVHESRRSTPPGWSPVRRADAQTIISLRVGLVQPNLESLHTYLMDVSHPESLNYGKHWDPVKVAQTFRPSFETIETVRAWLIEEGVEADRVRLSKSGGWVHVDVTVEEAERLLGTEYHVYQYGGEGGREHIACKEKYHLPEHVSKHVELVMPTLHFDVKVIRDGSAAKRDSPPGYKNMGRPGSGIVNPKFTGAIETVLTELANCDQQITPDCIRALYNFVYEPQATDKNTIGIVEYSPEAYLDADMDAFFGNYSPSQVGQRPALVSIDGGYEQTLFGGFSINGEADLDLQYAMALVGPSQNVTLYQAGDLDEATCFKGASFNNFLDALDASYCSFEGGDNPEYDAIYPDPYGGYTGPADCGTAPLSNVISTSYGDTEAYYGAAYSVRQCAEYGKV